MNAVNKKNRTVVIISLMILALSALFSGYIRQKEKGLNVSCSSHIRYHHQSPAFSAALEFDFRLEEDHDGYAILSGNIHSAQDIQVISRTVHFSYVMKRPGEIEISDMRYAKNPRDTADDDSFRYSFFYVPDGSTRQLKINSLRNGWLIGNPQSPFTFCISR
ncbi:hypothetical protein ACLBW0_02585 [Enterobacteriaceae bacterium C34A]